MNNSSSRRLFWALAAILVFVTALVFLRVAGFSFVMWDDDHMFYLNPHVQGLTADNFHWMFTDSTYNRLYMPLGWLDYALSYALFGLNPAAHHLVNLALHLANTLMVFILLCQVLAAVIPESAKLPRFRYLAAFAGALFWAVHPLRVEAVAWVGARVHCFASVFVLAALCCYFHAAGSPDRRVWRRPTYWLSVFLFGLSLLSFPIAVTLPLVLFVIDIYILRRASSGGGWKGVARLAFEKVPFALVVVVPLLVSLWGRAHTTVKNPAASLADFGLFARLMQACYCWMHYLGVMLFPTDLSPVYTTLVNFLPVDPIFLISFAGVAVITAVTFRLRRRYPAAWGVWLCHLIILLPFLGVTEHPHYASDRYTYLAGVVWSAVLAALVWRLFRLAPAQRMPKIAGLSAVALVTISFAFLAFQQTSIWTNSEVLFRYVIAQLGDDPYRADIYRRLGIYYLMPPPNSGPRRPADAFAAFTEILQLADKAREESHSMGEVRSIYVQAGQAFDTFSANVPGAQGLTLAGYAYDQAGFPGDAVKRLALAAQLAPKDANIHLALGQALFQMGKSPEALAELDTALALDPKRKPDRDKILAEWSATAARYAAPRPP